MGDKQFTDGLVLVKQVHETFDDVLLLACHAEGQVLAVAGDEEERVGAFLRHAGANLAHGPGHTVQERLVAVHLRSVKNGDPIYEFYHKQ